MAIGTPTSIGSTSNDPAPTIVLTTTATADVGDTILVFTGARGANILSATDSTGGNTYAIDIQNINGTATCGVVRARVASQLASGGTITVTYDANCINGIVAAVKVSGLDSSPLDKTSSHGAFSATAWTSNATATTTLADELVFGGGTGSVVTTTSTPDAPQNELFDLQSGSNVYACHYQIVAATGTYAISGTWGAAPSEQMAVVATYKMGIVVQTLRPDADTTTTGWTSTPLFSKINETAADGTVITATAS